MLLRLTNKVMAPAFTFPSGEGVTAEDAFGIFRRKLCFLRE